jgi:O-antigen ligase/tetratricopeptide (TPR) repeat protein
MFYSEKIENIYIWWIKILLYIIPFLALYIPSSMIFPYITGRNFAFRILVELATVLWLALICWNKKYRLHNTPILQTILIFTFIVGLADLSGVNPYKSFWSNYERMEGYITILHLVLYFILLKSMLKNRRDWMIFLNLFILAALLVTLYALIIPQKPSPFWRFEDAYAGRVYSTIGNPPFLAAYLLLVIVLTFLVAFNTKRLYIKFFYLFTIILHVMVIYHTASRSAILGGIAGMTIFCLFYLSGKSDSPREQWFKKIVLVWIGILIILLTVLAFLVLSNSDFIKTDRTLSRFANILSDPSVKTRLNAWKVGWEGIKERPVLGWGQENFMAVYSVNHIPYMEEIIWVDRAHNIIIDWLVNAGILGLISYVAIFGIAFYVLWKKSKTKVILKKEAVTIISGLAGYFVLNLFLFDTINTYLIFFTLLAYIDNIEEVKSMAVAADLEIRNRHQMIRVKPIIIIFALLVFSVLVYFINYKPIKQSQLLINIMISTSNFKAKHSSSNLPDILDDFNKALSFNTFGGSEIREAMVNISHYLIYYRRYTEKGAMEFIRATVKEIDKFISFNRHNLSKLNYAINFYTRLAQYEPSVISDLERLIKECLRLNPEYERLYFALADVYVLKEDYEGAFKIVRNMAIRDPYHERKQFKLAIAAILASKKELAEEALENVRKIRMTKYPDVLEWKKHGFTLKELNMIAESYMKAHNYNEALRYYRKMLSLLPEKGILSEEKTPKITLEALFHFKIAEIYLALGDKENAMREATKAAELDPENFSDRAKSIIDSLNNEI